MEGGTARPHGHGMPSHSVRPRHQDPCHTIRVLEVMSKLFAPQLQSQGLTKAVICFALEFKTVRLVLTIINLRILLRPTRHRKAKPVLRTEAVTGLAGQAWQTLACPRGSSSTLRINPYSQTSPRFKQQSGTWQPCTLLYP